MYRKPSRSKGRTALQGNGLSFALIVVGLVNIIIQLVMPDVVPNAINGYIQNSQNLGVIVLYKIFLFLWYFGGIVCFIGGIIRWARS
jgi:hypothetical protein